jgi:hypothetical protein
MRTKVINFTAEDLKRVEAAETKELAQQILDAIIDASANSKSPTSAEKVRALHVQVSRARNKNEVIAIGYNMLLSGEGLSTLGSRYQSRFAK